MPPKRTRIQKLITKAGSIPKPDQPRRKAGRPSTYNEEMAKRICDEVATTTRGLQAICEQNPSFPDHATIYRWLIKYSAFRDLYALAKKDQCQLLADELLTIADNPKLGQVVRLWPNGTKKDVQIADMTEHRKIQIDVRKWLLARLKPREYGDKLEVTDDRDPLGELLDQFKNAYNGLPPETPDDKT